MEDGDDPIVEELRRIRWQICKKVGGTPEAYARYYYELDKKIFGENPGKVMTGAEVGAAMDAIERAGRVRKTAKPAGKTSSRTPRVRRKAVTA